MYESNIVEFAGRDAISDPSTALKRKGARELLQSAVEAELEVFMARFQGRKTPEGHASVVRNGHHPERAVQTGIGPVTVKVPKVRSKTGKPVTFHSALVPPCVRKAKSLEAALPWLYLKGEEDQEMIRDDRDEHLIRGIKCRAKDFPDARTGEMDGALKALLGPEAAGFSAKSYA